MKKNMMVRRFIIFILCTLFIFCSKKDKKQQEPFFKIKADTKDKFFQNGFVMGASYVIPLYREEDKDSIRHKFSKGVYGLFDRPFYLSKDQEIKGKGKVFINQLNESLGLENEVFQKILDNVSALSLDLEAKNADAFFEKEEKWMEEVFKLLLDPTLDKDFVISQKKDLEYLKKARTIIYLINYERKWDETSNSFIPNGRKLSSEEKDKLETLIKQSDFNDELLFKKGFFYKHFLDLYVRMFAHLNSRQKQGDYFLNYFNLIDDFFKSRLIKEYFWFDLIKKHLTYDTPSTNIASSYNFYQSKSKNLSFKSHIEFLYKELSRLEKGMEIPEFSYEDINGQKVRLSDFKGNYLYIHVWATWCGPCIYDFPSLKKVKEQYKGKPIKFVSISLDSDKGKWKKMVKKEKLDYLSTELIADGDFDSDFSLFFKIRAIPRYILLDKEGKILERSAPRPDKIENLLNSLSL